MSFVRVFRFFLTTQLYRMRFLKLKMGAGHVGRAVKKIHMYIYTRTMNEERSR